MSKVYMTKDGAWLFVATEVYTLHEYEQNEIDSKISFITQNFTSIGYLVEFELEGGYCDFSHGRVIKKEALHRKAFCLGDL